MAPRFSPLDDELELLPGDLSPTLQAQVALVGANLSFARAREVLAALLAVRVSTATVRRITERAGAALVAAETAALAQLTRDSPPAPVGAPRQQLSVDGAMVPLVGGVWREVRTLAIGTLPPPDRPAKTAELSYFSRMTEAETFTQLATLEVHRRGTEHAAVVVADGAPWCQDFFDWHCPSAIRILDFAHAVGYLGSVAQAVFGAGTEAASAWLGTQTHTLGHGDPAAVLTAIAQLPIDHAPDPQEAAETQQKALTYLTSRQAAMDYATFSKQGLPIGSGAVESANKLVVEARLKGPGMHWTPTHVDPMLSLRTAICSHRWSEAWTQLASQWRHQQHRRTLPQPHPEPRPVSAPATLPPVRPIVPSTPRPKLFINGKPTADHPWKQPFFFGSRRFNTQITKD